MKTNFLPSNEKSDEKKNNRNGRKNQRQSGIALFLFVALSIH